MPPAIRQLDGEWIDGTAVMPSGDGTAGGNFSFRFNTLPGDGTAERRGQRHRHRQHE